MCSALVSYNLILNDHAVASLPPLSMAECESEENRLQEKQVVGVFFALEVFYQA